MKTGWLMQRHYGENHLIPLLDSRIHTIPMCGCGPTYQVHWPHRPNFYRHNAVDAERK